MYCFSYLLLISSPCMDDYALVQQGEIAVEIKPFKSQYSEKTQISIGGVFTSNLFLPA